MKTIDFYTPKDTKGPWYLSRIEGAIKEFVKVFNPQRKIESTIELFLKEEAQRAESIENNSMNNDFNGMSPEKYYSWILSNKDCHDWVLEYYFSPKQT